MNQHKVELAYEEYSSSKEILPDDALLLEKARKTTKNAYAPYSQFHVGAAAKLANGEYVTGSNQENASFPVGICAERVLLSAASSLYPNIPIKSIAISYEGPGSENDHPVAPCGICRQTLHEFETRTKQPIRLILSGAYGKVFIIPHSGALLPLAFSGEQLRNAK